jgi:hypothetical protein
MIFMTAIRRISSLGLLLILAAGSMRTAAWAAQGTTLTIKAPKAVETPKAAETPLLTEPRKLDLPAVTEKARPKKELSPPLAALRDRVRRTLVALKQQPFNTRDNTCVEILDFCRAFGCETTISDGGQSGQPINGITCLCWNMPCWGFQPLTVVEGHLAPRVGFGYQDAPSEMAAVLAMARVPLDYPARCDKVARNVADLIEYEKLTCRAGSNMSLKLVALSYYATEPTWKDNRGEEWSIQRLVKEELDRPVGNAPHAGTSRLLGLASALQCAAKEQKAIDGDLLRAKQYVDESIEYTLKTQNGDGSWGRITSRDYPTALSSTGRMIEWLVIAMPDERIEEPALARSVDFVEGLLSSQHYRGYVHSLSSREIAAVMHAAHALVVYDQRVFAPADPSKATPEKSAEGESTPTVRQASSVQGE